MFQCRIIINGIDDKGHRVVIYTHCTNIDKDLTGTRDTLLDFIRRNLKTKFIQLKLIIASVLTALMVRLSGSLSQPGIGVWSKKMPSPVSGVSAFFK